MNEITTFSKYNESKQRTVPITVGGKVRWITRETRLAIVYDWRQIRSVKYAAMLGRAVSNFVREFEIFELRKYGYVLRCHDGAIDTLEVVENVLSLSQIEAQYNADPRWMRI